MRPWPHGSGCGARGKRSSRSSEGAWKNLENRTRNQPETAPKSPLGRPVGSGTAVSSALGLEWRFRVPLDGQVDLGTAVLGALGRFRPFPPFGPLVHPES